MFSFFRDFDRSFFPMTQTSSFSALGISPEILEAIEVLGFDTPSSIQEQAIPAAISGADIVGLSHTGSGKTLAFAIPALECIEPEERCVQVLALCPTHTAWGSADIAPFRLDDWFGHSDSSLLSSRFILQATLYSRTA